MSRELPYQTVVYWLSFSDFWETLSPMDNPSISPFKSLTKNVKLQKTIMSE